MKETRREQTAHYIAAPQAESLQVAEPGEPEGQVNLTEAVDILRQHNAWRRDNYGNVPRTNPKLLGQAIDKVCECVPELVYALKSIMDSDDANELHRDHLDTDHAFNNARSALDRTSQP